MSTSVKPETQGERIRRNVEAMRSQGATEHDIETYLTQHEGLQPQGEAPTPATNDEQFWSMVGQGASLGFGAKILGGIDAADKYLNGDKAFGTNYAATRDRIMRAESEGVEAHPVAGRAIELLSGALPFVASGGAGAGAKATGSTLGRVGRGVVQGAKVGAGFGAASGVGHATGDLGDYLREARQGATVGALLGGTVGGAAPAVGATLSAALDRFGLRPQETPATPPASAPNRPAVAANALQAGSDPALADPRNRAILETPGFTRLKPRAGTGGVVRTGPFIQGEQPQGMIDFSGDPRLSRDQRALLSRTGVGETPEKPAPFEPTPMIERTPGPKPNPTGGYSVPVGATRAFEPLRGLAPDVASMQERGRSVLLKALDDAGMTPEAALAKARELSAKGQKPETIMDIAGRPGARLGRTMRAASPKAGDVIDEALSTRAEGAQSRAIDDALETSGLKQRSSGFKTARQLIDERASEADKSYQPAFADETPVNDERVTKLLQTPAGKSAWNRALSMMKNDGVKVPAGQQMTEVEIPGAKGLPSAKIPVPETVPTPTIQQLHYLKLALDDMARPGMERGPGQGGLGYNEAKSIRGVTKKLLDVMDEASPAYKAARQKYADKSALIDANELGRKLWKKMTPEDAAHEYAQLGSDAEREVFRRAGMDALADRLENGPENVERGAKKPRDLARIKLLFGNDDAAFNAFRERIAREAQMHTTRQTVSGNSQTADKLADLAAMADVPLGTSPSKILSAALHARGKLASRKLAEATAPMLTKQGDDLAALLEELQQTYQRQVAKGARSSRLTTATAAGIGSASGRH